jgi:ribonuclease BN (tRNA processing enzyme)
MEPEARQWRTSSPENGRGSMETDDRRRGVLKSMAGLAALAAALPALGGPPRPAFAQSRAANSDPATKDLQPEERSGTHLVLLGTRGGPGVDLYRAETSSLVMVGDTPYLVDCGYDTMRNLVECGVGYLAIGTIFFTHLHDDHTADLPALLSHQWTGGSTDKTEVYGPYGTEAMVQGALAFFKANTEIRTVDEGRTVRPETLFHGHNLEATGKPAQAYKDDKVTVTSVENTHFPARSRAAMPYRSLAYRFDSADRSIVFSGDTAYSENIVDLARGADIYVSEIMSQYIYDQMVARAKEEAGKGNENSIFRHVAETHSRPADVGRTAREAKVKTLVLNHLLPGATNPGQLSGSVEAFIDGVRKEFNGTVIVGADRMVI